MNTFDLIYHLKKSLTTFDELIGEDYFTSEDVYREIKTNNFTKTLHAFEEATLYTNIDFFELYNLDIYEDILNILDGEPIEFLKSREYVSKIIHFNMKLEKKCDQVLKLVDMRVEQEFEENKKYYQTLYETINELNKILEVQND